MARSVSPLGISVRPLNMEERMALEKDLQYWATAADVPLHLVKRDILRLDLAQLCRKERLIFWQVMQ
jgi:hypothetical protein